MNLQIIQIKIEKINLLVYERNINKEKKDIIKLKEIICSKWGEKIRIIIEDYKIKLFGCKNKHEINNISFEEFENIENIDESKIKCDKCKINNKENTFENIFYKCNTCKMNLCPLCKLNHDKLHNIINYDLKNYICDIHNEKYISYCKNCNKNMCIYCSDEHNNHETNLYKIQDKNNKIKVLKELRNKINYLNKDI